MRRVAFAAALCVSFVAAAEDKPVIAVFDLEAKGASPRESQACTLAVIRGLRELDVFSVISSDDVRKLLDIERARAIAGDESASSALTADLGGKNAITGTVTRLDATNLQVSLRLLDSSTHKVV